MLCRSPFMVGPIPCGCGKCPPCRVDRHRLLRSRMILESLTHDENAFITLTYDDDHVPARASLNPKDLQLFFKRLRLRHKVRYYGVGEYGGQTLRPHYHVACFGLGSCLRGGTDLNIRSCCPRCDEIKEVWENGAVHVGELNPHSISYLSKYVTKRQNVLSREERKYRVQQWEIGEGKYPEFARMSLRPGIGAPAVSVLHSSISRSGADQDVFDGDVPHTFRYKMSLLPIGRYLRGKLREQKTGSKDLDSKVAKRFWLKMWALRKDGEVDPQRTSETFRDYLVDKSTQKWRNLEAKLKIKETIKHETI